MGKLFNKAKAEEPCRPCDCDVKCCNTEVVKYEVTCTLNESSYFPELKKYIISELNGEGGILVSDTPEVTFQWSNNLWRLSDALASGRIASYSVKRIK